MADRFGTRRVLNTAEVFVLGGFTILSTAVFGRPKRADGADETRQKDIYLGWRAGHGFWSRLPP
jgi:hypothetical protein